MDVGGRRRREADENHDAIATRQMMRIETIAEQEVDRARTIIRLGVRGRGRWSRDMSSYGNRNYRGDKGWNRVSDSCSNGGWIDEARSV